MLYQTQRQTVVGPVFLMLELNGYNQHVLSGSVLHLDSSTLMSARSGGFMMGVVR